MGHMFFENKCMDPLKSNMPNCTSLTKPNLRTPTQVIDFSHKVAHNFKKKKKKPLRSPIFQIFDIFK